MKPCVVQQVNLTSDSKRSAQYQLKLLELPFGTGYVVEKLSGPAAGAKIAEAWYRETIEAAKEKYDDIVRKKTTRKTGRQYHEMPLLKEQLSLL